MQVHLRAVHTTPASQSPADMLNCVPTNLLADARLPETSWLEDVVEPSWEEIPDAVGWW